MLNVTVYIYSLKTRFDPDRLGQERLAGDRLRQRKGRKLKLPAESGKAAKGSSSTELMTAVIKEVTWKQAQEREVSIEDQQQNIQNE